MIIGFTGKAGAGKSTAAQMLIDEAVASGAFKMAKRMSFAEPIKRIAKECFGWNGEKDTRGRRLLQVLGTEAGRNYKPDIWVEALLKEIGNDNSMLICIDDLRFPNEAVAIRRMGGYIFCLAGRGDSLGDNSGHVSEAGIPENLINESISNTGSLDDLRSSMRELIAKYVVPSQLPVRRTGAGTFIQTWTGAKFDFAKPELESIWLEDIAHALARICRFGGHLSGFYSVVDHSINVARLLSRQKQSGATVFWGLLHDASEAYIGDIVSPLKRMLPTVVEFEEKLQILIRRRFGLSKADIDFAAVKNADESLLVAEAHGLFTFPPLDNWTESFRPAMEVDFLHISHDPSEAETNFLFTAKAMMDILHGRRELVWN